jgi:hypothetical protein
MAAVHVSGAAMPKAVNEGGFGEIALVEEYLVKNRLNQCVRAGLRL